MGGNISGGPYFSQGEGKVAAFSGILTYSQTQNNNTVRAANASGFFSTSGLSGYAEDIQINSQNYTTDSASFQMAASVSYLTSSNNFFVVSDYNGAPYSALTYINLNNNTYNVMVNNLTNSVLGNVSYPLFAFFDEYSANFYYQLVAGGPLYSTNAHNLFITNTEIISGATILFMMRYGYAVKNPSNNNIIDLYDWSNIKIISIDASLMIDLLNPVLFSFVSDGLYTRGSLTNQFAFFPFSNPLFSSYFPPQRHYAYNYSRGVPINQGTQNLILPPNRNIIL